MATGNGTPPPVYTVTLTASVGARFRTLAAFAVRYGLLASYTQALDTLQRRLQTDPGGWGDPIRDRPAAGLHERRVMEPTFVIHYGIQEASRLVIVRDVRLNPYSELARLMGY